MSIDRASRPAARTGAGGREPHAVVEARLECADALRELNLAAERLRQITAQHLGLSIVDSLAVSLLLSEGPLGQRDLAVALAMTTGSITALVDRLEERYFVERTPHPTDRRRMIVGVTDHGRRLLAQTGDWTAEAFAGIDPTEYADATRIMRAIADGLRASGDTLSARPAATANPSRLR